MRMVMTVLMGGALLALPVASLAADRPVVSDAARSQLSVPERKFVERAASDNLAEIELGRLALDKTRSAEVRNLAQTMVDDHKKSLDQLKSIASDHQFPLPASATTRAQTEVDQLSKLSGEPFDRQYLKLMSERHVEAIDTFQKASSQLQDQDLKSYAAKTLSTLKEHQGQVEIDLKK